MIRLIYKNTTFHVVNSIRTELPSTTIIVTVVSYKTELDYLIGNNGVLINEILVPVSVLSTNNITRSISQWLISNPDSIFYDGTVVNNYSSDPLEFTKDKQWLIVKDARNTKISAIDMDLDNNTIKNQIATYKDIARDLKAQIYAATEIEDVLQIAWPN